jgi:hypothetical protein
MNQHNSPKREIFALLYDARWWLRHGGALAVVHARNSLGQARALIDAAPASTRRRWKAGR